MTEQPHQPLDHAEPPAADADRGSAATQPLPSPAELAAAAARAARAAEVANAQAAASRPTRPIPSAAEVEAAAAQAAASRPTQPIPSPAEVEAAVNSRAELDVTDATQPLPPPPPKQHPEHRPPTAMIATMAAGVLLVGAVLVVLIGRIDRDHDPKADAAPQTFSSPQALVDYLDRRGLPCTGYEAVDAAPANVPAKAVGRGRCTAAGSPVGVGVYAGPSDVEAQWSSESGQSGKSGHGPLFMALGANWTIDGPADWTRRVADVMSAQFRTQP